MNTKVNRKRKITSSITCIVFVLAIVSNCFSVLAADSKYNVPDAGGKPNFISYEYYTAFGRHNGTRNSAIAYGLKYKGHKYNTKTDSKTGARMCEGCYCVALGTYFKRGAYKGCGIGSKFVITFSSGKQINAIWTDEKADKDTDSLHIHHKADGSYLEVVCEKGKLPSNVRRAGSYYPIFKGKMVSVVPTDKAVPSNNDGSSSTNDTNSFIDNDFTVAYNPVSDVVCKIFNIDVAENKNSFVVLKNDKTIKKIKKFTATPVKNSKIQTSKNLKKAISKLDNNNYYTTDGIDYSGISGSPGVSTGYLGMPLKTHNGISAGKPGYPRYSSGKWHAGTDYRCSEGTKVYAADGGVATVKINYRNGGYYSYGIEIIIKCTDPTTGKSYRMIYGHLSKVTIKSGQVISKGQEIGRSGSTGNSTGPHLHLEIDYPYANYHSVILPSEYMGKMYFDRSNHKVKVYKG